MFDMIYKPSYKSTSPIQFYTVEFLKWPPPPSFFHIKLDWTIFTRWTHIWYFTLKKEANWKSGQDEQFFTVSTIELLELWPEQAYLNIQTNTPELCPYSNSHSPSCLIKLLSYWNWNLLVFATSIKQDQPAHPCSMTRLYTVDWQTLSSHLDIPKYDNEQCQRCNVAI